MTNKRKVQDLKAKVVIDDAPEKSTDEVDVEDEVKAFISSMSKRLNRSSDARGRQAAKR